ncbi:hypothetical protein BJV74DRAFT_794361 [Russula compacta]|nr:hypothetical protein BJV74DRAFT_794361 [Russula compacta]
MNLKSMGWQAQGAARQVDAGQGAGTGRLIAQAGRQGQPQQVWLGEVKCKLAGMSADGHGHRDMDAGMGMWMQMQAQGHGHGWIGNMNTRIKKLRQLTRLIMRQAGASTGNQTEVGAASHSTGVADRQLATFHIRLRYVMGPVVWLSVALAIG